MPASHQHSRGSSAAASRGRRTQHRAHPRRGRRRARRRPGGEHGRDRSPRGGRARDHLRALPHPRGAARCRHRARARRSRPPSSPRPNPSAATPPTRSRGSSRRRGARSGATTRSSPSTPARRRPRSSTTATAPCSAGCCRSSNADRPTAPSARTCPPRWHLSMLMALVHAGSAELRAGRVPDGPTPRRRWSPPSSARSRVPGRRDRHGVADEARRSRRVEVAELASPLLPGVGSAHGRSRAQTTRTPDQPVAGVLQSRAWPTWASPRPETSKETG